MLYDEVKDEYCFESNSDRTSLEGKALTMKQMGKVSQKKLSGKDFCLFVQDAIRETDIR